MAKNLNLEKNIYFCNHTFDMSATSMRASVDNMKVRVVSLGTQGFLALSQMCV